MAKRETSEVRDIMEEVEKETLEDYIADKKRKPFPIKPKQIKEKGTL